MPPNPPPDYVPPGEEYFEPEGSDDNVEIVGQYSEPPLAHQNGA